MKRIIAAVAFAVLAVPAAAAEIWLPYEQDQFDRTLPNVQNPAADSQTRASAGATSARTGSAATGVWAKDHNFIAPAQ